MTSAYNTTWLRNLKVVKEVKRWYKHGLITEVQFKAIGEAYTSSLYHPSIIIRILLFLATLLAISGITGLLTLMVLDADENARAVGAIFYGLMSFLVLEMLFFKKNNHYKSGVSEAILYHSILFTLGGIIFIVVDSVDLWLIISLVVLTLCAIRYIDIVCTVVAIGVFVALLFYELYEMEGIFRQIIPFMFIMVFTPVYFIAKKIKERETLNLWHTNLLVVESISLLLIYFGGNYLVVRELSVAMMDLTLEEGEDIPFAFLFYTLTVIIPVSYFYLGIRNKDVVLIRISLLLLALSAFTFKYYFSFGHPEITLTISGAIILAITLVLLNYLKVMRNGYTRENLLSEKWGDANLEAFIISQTVGGNVVPDSPESGGGGQFGGGGSTDSF